MTEPIVAFLNARYAEREAAAHAAALSAGTTDGTPDPEWVATYTGEMATGGVVATGLEHNLDAPLGAHIAMNDPAHVLADITAGRRILWWHDKRRGDRTPWGEPVQICWCGYDKPCSTIRFLAEPFSQHPDYDPAWTIPAPPRGEDEE